MPAGDRMCVGNQRNWSPELEISGKYGERLGNTPEATSVKQRENSPQGGVFADSAQESEQVLVERGTSELEKFHVAGLVVCYSGQGISSVGGASDPGKLADSPEQEAPTAEAQHRDIPECGSEQGVVPGHAAVWGHLAELTGGRVPNEIPGSALANRASARLRVAQCEAAVSITSDLARPCSPYTVASALTMEACLPLGAESGADAAIVFDGHGFSRTQSSSPAFSAGICSDGVSDRHCSHPSAHGFSWLQTTSHPRFNQKQLLSNMKLTCGASGVEGRED
ncbi:hypothetical protein HPB50_018246 [Hyalomma asiaticum]|uniref:Uncharacterized protein n=1 Tax=Hyalomma asiaticum TaxID=266040 RepID=A0ACB7S6H0_HYAAI|nr:hypothetical protein HPB50_018246 [Hyalomma asiaticum]